MKTIFVLLVAGISLGTQAFELNGIFKVETGCKINNSRIAALSLLYREGSLIEITTNQNLNAIIVNGDHQDTFIPLNKQFKDNGQFMFKNYLDNSQILDSSNALVFLSKGTEMRKCSNYPLPGNHICLQKWDDKLKIEKISDEDIHIEWKFDTGNGVCTLKRV